MSSVMLFEHLDAHGVSQHRNGLGARMCERGDQHVQQHCLHPAQRSVLSPHARGLGRGGRALVSAVMVLLVIGGGDGPPCGVGTLAAYRNLPAVLKGMSITRQGALFERLAQIHDQSLGFKTSSTAGGAVYDYDRQDISEPASYAQRFIVWKACPQ